MIVDYNNLIKALRNYSSENEEQYDIVAVLYLFRATVNNLMENKNRIEIEELRNSFTPEQKHYFEKILNILSH